jgi:hypothetical protein
MTDDSDEVHDDSHYRVYKETLWDDRFPNPDGATAARTRHHLVLVDPDLSVEAQAERDRSGDQRAACVEFVVAGKLGRSVQVWDTLPIDLRCKKCQARAGRRATAQAAEELAEFGPPKIGPADFWFEGD